MGIFILPAHQNPTAFFAEFYALSDVLIEGIFAHRLTAKFTLNYLERAVADMG